MKRIALLLCVAAMVGCSNQTTPQVQKPVEEPETWTEIQDGKVEFVRMHPNAAQKNTYLTWHLFENDKTHERTYRVDERNVSPEANKAVGDLLDAVGRDLVKSDGVYACRYRENQPQYRLEFNKDGHHYSVISSSDCLHGAPFNVRMDNDPGQWWLQMSGAMGIALENALQLSGSHLHVGETPGLIMLDKTVHIEGYEGMPSSSTVLTYYDERFRGNAELASFLNEAAPMFGFQMAEGRVRQETLPVEDHNAVIPLPEVACNQSNSPDCSQVSGRYTLHIGNNVYYQIPVKMQEGAVQVSLPPNDALKSLKTLTRQSMFKAYWAAVCGDSFRKYLENGGTYIAQDGTQVNAQNSHPAGTMLPLVVIPGNSAENADQVQPKEGVLLPDDLCGSIKVQWSQNEKTLKHLSGVKKFMQSRDKAELKRGSSWSVSATGFPSLVYYDELDAYWIEPVKNESMSINNLKPTVILLKSFCDGWFIDGKEPLYPYGTFRAVTDFADTERKKSDRPLTQRLCAKNQKPALFWDEYGEPTYEGKAIYPGPVTTNLYFSSNGILAEFRTSEKTHQTTLVTP